MSLHTLATRIFAFTVHMYLLLVYHTCRLSTTHLEAIESCVNQGTYIFAFWHGRMFFPVYYYGKRIKTRKASILISQSRDGDYGDALVTRLKQDSVRGSSSRGGLRAVHQLVERLSQGYNLALTPDGPRGPAFHVHIGIIKLAQLTGTRIIPVTYQASRKIHLKSWDRFIIPLPFCRVHLAFGDPMEIPKACTPAELQRYRQQLETTLTELDRLCDQQAGCG